MDLDLRRVRRRQVQIRERDAPDAFRTDNVYFGAEGDEGVGEVAGIGRDAMLAGPEHRVLAIDPADRAATRSRIAFVAGGKVGESEVVAARPLEHVAAQARHVAQLRAGRQPQGLGDHRIVSLDDRMFGGLAHARQRAQPQPGLVGADPAV